MLSDDFKSACLEQLKASLPNELQAVFERCTVCLQPTPDNLLLTVQPPENELREYSSFAQQLAILAYEKYYSTVLVYLVFPDGACFTMHLCQSAALPVQSPALPRQTKLS